MLTQRDIAEIERIVEEKIGEKINLLPTKDQYFGRMDELSGQIKKLQETWIFMMVSIRRSMRLKNPQTNG